ncbi:hypothetical protein IQ254_16555 [Nodosilinea sp. LEGE 07088]|uniref:hypothetical protein n=1 Tax=Nodosilinea sp. LEGE 07088 TaxID=2777968 RepID=UPI00187EBDA7|nr:hypothetical protein [Nodosilinea sp. LEGE 07088]MBE9138785.1 hypothetical protein [Nodosilinea sp. LEGE 07088]
MLPDLIGATRDYWRKLDAVEAAYRRNELTAAEVNAQVNVLMAELGQTRRQLLRDSWAIFQTFVNQQGEALAGVAALGGLAYLWLVANGQA